MKPTAEIALEIHEEGHRLANLHYRKNCRVVIIPPAERQPQNANDSTIAVGGYCERDSLQRITPFQGAVVGWSGIMAEIICGVSPFTKEKACAKNLRAIYGEVMVSFERLSTSDQRHIYAYKRSFWATFRRAYKILFPKKKSLLKFMAAPVAPPPDTAAIEKEAIQYRAEILRKYLVGLAQDNPDRPRLEAMLLCLENGKWPETTTTNTN
jgi:hypothetical protein